METSNQNAFARAAFSVAQFRPDSSDSPAERQRKEVGVHSYFGFPSYDQLFGEFSKGFEPWTPAFWFHERMTIDGLLASVEQLLSGTKRARTSAGEHSMSLFDVFCLPFRCLAKSESIEEMSVDYCMRCAGSFGTALTRFSTAHMARIVHNAVLMVACLWAPNLFHWPSDPVSREAIHPLLAPALRVAEGEDIFVFLADCTEIIAQASSHLILHSYTYSFKLEHVHSLKLFLVWCYFLARSVIWRIHTRDHTVGMVHPIARIRIARGQAA
jgi:hypothetical protein